MSAAVPERSERTALASGAVGIATFVGAVVSVSWMPERADVLVAISCIGLAMFAVALAMAKA